MKSLLNTDGFDVRIIDELDTNNAKEFDTVFVGGLGRSHFGKRTELMSKISDTVNFKWWGYKNDELKSESLEKTYQGATSGLDMFNIYKKSAIVLNDYINSANGVAINQRIFEVLGVGSFMLTRRSENLGTLLPRDSYDTFTDDEDCIRKIHYYLKNAKEREEKAKIGQQFILEKFNYKKLISKLSDQLREAYFEKFGTS